jgi:hypothetical protein
VLQAINNGGMKTMASLEVSHLELGKLLKQFRAKGIPLFVSGATGVGKSETILNDSKVYATEIGREWVDYKSISSEQKRALLNPVELSKYHLFIDIRTALLEPTDLMGIPFAEGDFVSWKPNLMMKLLSMEEISATAFFDEFNLGSRMVQNSAYQIVLDKAIGELKFGRDVFIVSAGNRVEDGANIIEMAMPLKNRFAHLTLSVPTNDEFVKWLLNTQYPDTRICSLLKFAPELVFNFKPNLKEDAFATPRSIYKLAQLTHDLDEQTQLPLIRSLANAVCGSPFAMKYEGFLKLTRKVDVDEILNNPKKVRELKEIDLKYALVSGVASKMRGKWNDLGEKCFAVCDELEEEYAVFLLKMVKEIVGQASFSNRCLKSDLWNNKLSTKIADLFGA